MMKRRYGVVKVSKEMVKEFWLYKNLNLVPLKIEFDYPRDCFVIEGYCNKWDLLSEHDVIPEYRAIFKIDILGRTRLFWEK
jgi:hypothetical protein